MSNALARPAFPGNQCPASGFLYMSGTSPSRNRNGTSFPCQWHHREQNNPNCRERRRRLSISKTFIRSIDGGRFPVKRIVGERVEVWADIYRDGHEVDRRGADLAPRARPRMAARADDHHSNDRWAGSFVPDEPGRYVYAIEAWTDEFATWRHGFELKQKAGADLTLDADRGRRPADQGAGRRPGRRGRDPAAMRGLPADRRCRAAA